MKLADYLVQEKLTPEAFAEKINRSKSGVRKWVYGQRVPRPADMARIAEITQGHVMPNDFMAPRQTVAA